MRLLGQLTQGLYKDDPLDRVDPNTLHLYYGYNRQRTEEEVAESSDDDSISDAEENDPALSHLVEEIGRHQSKNIKHSGARVARHESPFSNNPEGERLFMETISDICSAGLVPRHYGVHPNEVADAGGYPTYETINYGARGKALTIQLPEDVWFPRAVLWVQGLIVLRRHFQMDS
jgi:hypothetical protein